MQYRNLIIIIVILTGMLLLINISENIYEIWQQNNVMRLEVYSQKYDRYDLRFCCDIVTETAWDLSRTTYDEEVTIEWLDFLNNINWNNEIEVPDRVADEIVVLRKGGLGYGSWKVWYSEEVGVYMQSGDDKRAFASFDEYNALP